MRFSTTKKNVPPEAAGQVRILPGRIESIHEENMATPHTSNATLPSGIRCIRQKWMKHGLTVSS